jgi:hypothetical protein
MKREKAFIAKLVDYGLDPYSFNSNTVVLYRYLNKYIDILISKNIPPCFEETNKIINVWNTTGNMRFATHKTKSITKTIKAINVIVTYRMKIENYSLERILNGINIFSDISEKTKYLKYKKKLKLLEHYLWNDQTFVDKDWFKICTGPRSKLQKEISNAVTEYTNAFEVVQRNFKEIFFKNRRNDLIVNNILDTYHTLFVTFTNNMVEWHKELDMCGYEPRGNEGRGNAFERLIVDLFEYGKMYSKNYDAPMGKKIYGYLGDIIRLSFIVDKQQEDVDFENFFGEKEIIDIPEETAIVEQKIKPKKLLLKKMLDK